MGFSIFFGSLTYGEEWRRRRRAFHSQFQRNVVTDYQSMQLRETYLYIGNVLKNPDDALGLSRLCVFSIHTAINHANVTSSTALVCLVRLS